MNFIKEFNPPIDYLITPLEDRENIGMELINEFKKRFSGINLIYAYISEDFESDIDYLFIFNGYQMFDGNKISMTTIEAPLKYTSRCLNGFAYAKTYNQLTEYFNDVNNYSIILPSSSFRQILTNQFDLSLKEDDPRYWKSENNIEKLLIGIKEMCMLYNRHIPNRESKKEEK